MKLAEIKSGLIEQNFASNCNGISGEPLFAIFEKLGSSLGLDLSQSVLDSIMSSRSNDPSKAFKKFTEGHTAVMSFIEAEDEKLNTIFIAIRTGKTVKVANLTTDPISERQSDLRSVREALKQAKNFNEDIIFELTVSELKIADHLKSVKAA